MDEYYANKRVLLGMVDNVETMVKDGADEPALAILDLIRKSIEASKIRPDED